MKTIYKRNFFSLLLITAVIAVIFTTCKKDEDCKAVITVKKQGSTPGDTLNLVPNADVKIHKFDVQVEGTSDGSGQFRYTFKLNAILDVDATLIVPADTLTSTPADSLSGYTILRLVPGKTVYKTVFIQ
jgi:hypothetical protein